MRRVLKGCSCWVYVACCLGTALFVGEVGMILRGYVRLKTHRQSLLSLKFPDELRR